MQKISNLTGSKTFISYANTLIQVAFSYITLFSAQAFLDASNYFYFGLFVSQVNLIVSSNTRYQIMSRSPSINIFTLPILLCPLFFLIFNNNVHQPLVSFLLVIATLLTGLLTSLVCSSEIFYLQSALVIKKATSSYRAFFLIRAFISSLLIFAISRLTFNTNSIAVILILLISAVIAFGSQLIAHESRENYFNLLKQVKKANVFSFAQFSALVFIIGNFSDVFVLSLSNPPLSSEVFTIKSISLPIFGLIYGSLAKRNISSFVDKLYKRYRIKIGVKLIALLSFATSSFLISLAIYCMNQLKFPQFSNLNFPLIFGILVMISLIRFTEAVTTNSKALVLTCTLLVLLQSLGLYLGFDYFLISIFLLIYIFIFNLVLPRLSAL